MDTHDTNNRVGRGKCKKVPYIKEKTRCQSYLLCVVTKTNKKNNGLNHVFRPDPTYKEVIQAQKAKIQAEIELGLEMG